MATKKSGFTLTEVMLAAAILSIGFVLIAGAFPVAAKLTATATERSIAAVTADEAFAKIQLYGLDMSQWDSLYAYTAPPTERGLTFGQHFDYSNIARLHSTDILPLLNNVPPPDTHEEYYYPTTKLIPLEEKIYHWSALCKRIDPTRVLVTVFVSRLGQIKQEYPANPIPTDTLDPAFVSLVVTNTPEPYMVQGIDRDLDNSSSLVIPSGYETYFREGAKILDDSTGEIYTINETGVDASIYYAVLDRQWQGLVPNDFNVWVIPSATTGGRWPCVGIFQRIIEFK